MREPLFTVVKPAPEEEGNALTGSPGTGARKLPKWMTNPEGSLNLPITEAQKPDGGNWLWGGGKNADALKSWLLILGIFAIGLFVVSAGRKK